MGINQDTELLDQELADCKAIRFDQRLIPGPEDRLLEPGAPAVTAGEDSVSSGGANRRR